MMITFRSDRLVLFCATLLAISSAVPGIASDAIEVAGGKLTPEQAGVLNKAEPFVIANPDVASAHKNADAGRVEQNVLGTDFTCGSDPPDPENLC